MPSTQEMANAPMVQILGAQGRAYGVEVAVAQGWMGPLQLACLTQTEPPPTKSIRTSQVTIGKFSRS